MSKYHVGGSQSHYQPGSDDRVLANKIGITDPLEMEDAELHLLALLYRWVFDEGFPEGAITSAELKHWHRRWLGNIYEWAGEERSVNLSKDGFHFAAAGQIPFLLTQLDQRYFSKLTPCTEMPEGQLIEAIAVVHVELILVHPFREGNGRLSRLLADVMAVQGGSEPLDYSAWDVNKEGYFSAIQEGLNANYQPMQNYVRRALV